MSIGNRITNIDIGKFYENKTNDDLKKIMGVYFSDSITKYKNFYDIITESRAKYPLAIFNTDREKKPGTHWWSFLDIFPKKTSYYLIVLVLVILAICYR